MHKRKPHQAKEWCRGRTTTASKYTSIYHGHREAEEGESIISGGCRWFRGVRLMACINMVSPEHQGLPISPRISFSNDFTVEAPKHERAPVAPPDPDFEFAVGGRPMMAADELFFKGRLLPLSESCTAAQLQRVTLRDELLAGEDEEEWDAASPSSRPLRGRWKELLGLRKASCATKKHDKGEGGSDRAATLMEEDAVVHAAKPAQELRGQGGARPKQTELGL